MAEKVTIMVLKVDLQCPCCYKKVKKILCKFPLVCCDPEKLRDKLCCKGAKVIKSIEIKEPEKPKPPDKPKEPEKPKPPPPKEPEKPKPPPPKEPEKPKPPEKPKDPPPPQKPKDPPAPAPPPIGAWCPPAIPVRTCCGPCSEGYGGGPCYFGFGVAPPPPPQPCFEGYYGYGWHERPCHVTRCDYYFCEENPQACSIM